MVLSSWTQKWNLERGRDWLMVGKLFFFLNVQWTVASGLVSQFLDHFGRYHTLNREILKALTQAGK